MKPMSGTFKAETAHNIFKSGENPLDVFFTPKNVAVIGATENVGSVGRTTLWNLISTPFGGTVFPVNPKRPSVLGIKAYPTVKDIPAEVDLAVIVTPAPTIPGIIRECGEIGVNGAVVISAGFKELGAPASNSNRNSSLKRSKAKMRIIGPNCLGVMSPPTGLNATFAAGMARPGNVGFISQSGALCTAVLDWCLEGNGRLQRLRLHRLDARRRLGRPDRLPRQRPQHPQHRHLHGIDRRRPLLPLRRPRSRSHQADHRHQSRPHRRRRQGRRLPHRLAHRQRRRARRRLPPLRRAARQQHLRPLLHGRSPRQAAPPQGPPPHHRHQRRRPRRARHRRPDHRRRRTDRALPRDHRRTSTRSCPPPGATTTRSTSSATPAPTATPRPSKSPPRIRTATACWSSSPRRP